MMDYDGFWNGFVFLFVALPLLVGLALGMAWAWRRGERGWRIMASALFGGVAVALCVFAGAILTFGA